MEREGGDLEQENFTHLYCTFPAKLVMQTGRMARFYAETEAEMMRSGNLRIL